MIDINYENLEYAYSMLRTDMIVAVIFFIALTVIVWAIPYELKRNREKNKDKKRRISKKQSCIIKGIVSAIFITVMTITCVVTGIIMNRIENDIENESYISYTGELQIDYANSGVVDYEVIPVTLKTDNGTEYVELYTSSIDTTAKKNIVGSYIGTVVYGSNSKIAIKIDITSKIS